MAASSSPYGAVPLVPGAEPLPELDVPPPGRQSRFTVLVRLLLLLPHAVILALLSAAMLFVTAAAWCTALLFGRVPDPLERLLAEYLGYETRVNAAAMLLTDRYPPFQLTATPGYPVQVRLRSTAQNRLAVLFRLPLALPALVLGALALAGWWAVSCVTWLVVLVLGRMPQPLFEATAAVLRYRMRVAAYVLLLTSSYPKRLFGDQAAPDAVLGTVRGSSATRPLFLGGTAKVLLGAFVAAGLLGWGGNALLADDATPTEATPSVFGTP
ncbi:DUF4389 domain-containing protein [Streptomyces sp. Q6]|uniref:DUF4389 domain-containing protein n=1 Tax=Streptomyces citrinus TaxID=3118173 RepID=A0ACD5AE31_9ACTN